MFDIALGIFLFLSPIFILLGNNARINGLFGALQYYQFKNLSLESNAVQLQFFQWGILFLFIVALSQKPVRYFQDRNFACLFGLCVLSTIFHPKILPVFIPILAGFLLYYLVVQYAKNIKKLFYIIVAISTLNTFFAILQFFKINFIYNLWSGSIVGMMFSSSHLGIYQALALPICYAINPFLAVIPFIGLILSKSFTPLLAGIIGMAYFLYPRKNRIFINLAPMGWIAVLGIIVIFLIQNYQNIIYKLGLRFQLWRDVLIDILHKPMGYGLGTFSKVYTGIGEWAVPQNEYLGCVYYIGILSLFFIYGFLKDKFIGIENNFTRVISVSCLIATITCLGQSALHFPRLAGTIIPLFAFLEIAKRKE